MNYIAFHCHHVPSTTHRTLTSIVKPAVIEPAFDYDSSFDSLF